MARFRFVPVPYDAMTALPPEDHRALLDLYRRAHTLRWRELEFTERSLMTSWHCTRSTVWRIMSTLDRLGMAKLTRGERRKPSRIELYEPTSDEPVQEGGQHDEQWREHNNVDCDKPF